MSASCTRVSYFTQSPLNDAISLLGGPMNRSATGSEDRVRVVGAYPQEGNSSRTPWRFCCCSMPTTSRLHRQFGSFVCRGTTPNHSLLIISRRQLSYTLISGGSQTAVKCGHGDITAEQQQNGRLSCKLANEHQNQPAMHQRTRKMQSMTFRNWKS